MSSEDYLAISAFLSNLAVDIGMTIAVMWFFLYYILRKPPGL